VHGGLVVPIPALLTTGFSGLLGRLLALGALALGGLEGAGNVLVNLHGAILDVCRLGIVVFELVLVDFGQQVRVAVRVCLGQLVEVFLLLAVVDWPVGRRIEVRHGCRLRVPVGKTVGGRKMGLIAGNEPESREEFVAAADRWAWECKVSKR
jgi:hypothetical protein